MKAQAQTATTLADPSPLRATPRPSTDCHDIDNPPMIASEDLECETLLTRDFLEKIHGHYIDGHAPTISWVNDSIVTVLLSLDNGLGGNLLEDDIDESTHQIPSDGLLFSTFYHLPYTTDPPTSTTLTQPFLTIAQPSCNHH